jgi:hypothetical protein
MSLDAFALLRLPHSTVTARSPEGVIVLTDAVLLETGASFAAEPAELAIGLRRLLGEALDAHDDTRGVYFLPAAAVEPARSAGSYAAVIEAIGEAGMWIAPVEEGATARPTMVEALMARAMDGEEIDPEALQGAVQASLAQLADSFAAGGDDDELEGEGTSPGAQMPMDLGALLSDPAMMALAQKMRDLMPPMGEAADDVDDDASYEDEGEEPTDGVGTELDGALPMDLRALVGSPAFAELLKNAQEVLAKNPEEAQKLAARFGLAAGAAGSDDEE